jgi:two-component system chemotaxis response regulator CheB
VPTRRIVTVGASAGGVESLVQLVSRLPADLPAAIFVVLHIPPSSRSRLPQILENAGHLPAFHVDAPQRIRRGQIYVAPPDRHLIIEHGRVRSTLGPRENGHRPAVDPLFRSAALAYGEEVAAVVLSGSLGDGTAGLALVRQRGGLAIVQEPTEALFPGMPMTAIESMPVDHILPVAGIARLLVEGAGESDDRPDDTFARSREARADEALADEAVADEALALAEMEGVLVSARAAQEPPGRPSAYSCPECGGVLWELEQDGHVRFRCRVGHAYSLDALSSGQATGVEDALWAAVRALEEQASLAGRVARRAKQRGRAGVADGYGRQHRDAATHADRLGTVLNDLPRRPGDSTTGTPGPEVRHSELDEQPGSELGGSASGRLPPDLK